MASTRPIDPPRRTTVVSTSLSDLAAAENVVKQRSGQDPSASLNGSMSTPSGPPQLEPSASMEDVYRELQGFYLSPLVADPEQAKALGWVDEPADAAPSAADANTWLPRLGALFVEAERKLSGGDGAGWFAERAPTLQEVVEAPPPYQDSPAHQPDPMVAALRKLSEAVAAQEEVRLLPRAAHASPPSTRGPALFSPPLPPSDASTSRIRRRWSVRRRARTTASPRARTSRRGCCSRWAER
jgi:hypothetical protein